ncbi:MAG: periplasmic heavy metal sensor [Elusimicrobiota bacterium]|nr:MAG: periplasmic heavy metal sensor [Elusimicrobiota bacterium]
MTMKLTGGVMKIAKSLLLGFGMLTFVAVQGAYAEDDQMGAMPPAGAAPAPAMGGMMDDDMMGEMGMPPKPGAAMGSAMPPAAAAPAPAMGGMMDKEMGGMAPKPDPAMGGMKDDPMMKKMDGMDMMGKMGAKGGMAGMSAPLPQMPGNPHIYHVGASGFFIDHAKRLGLSTEQKAAINVIKKQSLQRRADFKQKIVSAEQQLWALTDSDAPDAARIQAKLGEIEKLRAARRYDLINSVGEAAKVLTDHQRQMVVATPASGKTK